MSNPRLYQLNTQTGALTLTATGTALNVVNNAIVSGNVGIGTTNPTNKLHIEGGNAVGQIKVSGLEADIQMYSSGANSTWRLLGSTANSIKLFRIYDNDNGANRFIITSSGEVGIGTTQPQAKLGVQGNSGAGVDGGVLLDLFGGTISAANDGVGISFTRTGSQLGYIQAARENSSNEASILRFATQTSGGSHPERMRIDSSGNVAIGTTNATQKLTVNGALESLVDRAGGVDEGGQLILRSPAGGNTRWNIDNFQNKLRIFREDDSDTSNGAAYLHIVNGGNVGIGTTSPGYKLDVNGNIGSSSLSPLAFYGNGNSGTYTQTVIYANQNNTSGSTTNGLFIERGRLTDSSSGEIRSFVIGDRGGGIQFIINASGNVGIGTDNPIAHSGTTSALIVRGGGSGRGIIEVHDGNGTGKAVFQQVGTKTFVGNLAGNGALSLLVGGNGTNSTEAIIITNAGYATIPNQPAFSVYQSGSGSKTGTLTYNEVILNRGSHMNTTNGRFTAPIAGAYQISFMAFQDTGTTGVLEIQLYRNGSSIGVRSYHNDPNETYGPHQTISTVLNLNAGDYITVFVGGTIHGNLDGYFSGFLIG